MKSLFSPSLRAPVGSRTTQAVTLCLAVLALVLMSPHAALAYDATYLGDILCSATVNLIPKAGGGLNWGLAGVINGVAYISGAIMIGAGLLLLAKSYEDGRNTPLHQPIARIVAGACLLSFPAFVAWLLNSLYLVHGPGGIEVAACAGNVALSDSGIVYAGGTDVPLDALLINLVTSIADPLTILLSMISMIVGLIFIFRGLSKASRFGTDPRAYSPVAVLSHLVIGAALVSIGATETTVINTLFGFYNDFGSARDFWAGFERGFGSELNLNGGQLAEFEAGVSAALTFFQLIGFIGFIRGWMILKGYAEGSNNATAAQGLTHIIGGALAINIYQVLIILDMTFGTGFLAA